MSRLADSQALRAIGIRLASKLLVRPDVAKFPICQLGESGLEFC